MSGLIIRVSLSLCRRDKFVDNLGKGSSGLSVFTVQYDDGIILVAGGEVVKGGLSGGCKVIRGIVECGQQ